MRNKFITPTALPDSLCPSQYTADALSISFVGSPKLCLTPALLAPFPLLLQHFVTGPVKMTLFLGEQGRGEI